MSPAAHQRLFAVLAVALIVLHVDTWNAGPGPLVFGWLPWDLAYHLAWMAAAAVLVFYMTSSALWPEDPDDP
ncbi:hypothetical protein SAMN02745121_04565 [Nannocystis exedens]|uniref:Solute:sodium symporter small subunit n=1 Tax=Nannocystis exedens TaxID=54 RepID=A0A1I2BB67_9BACT|nr:hypothetical protein [Nannocystis exedens]PCC68090.1 hypothetical protein NAEX_01099 [Nannocystis exedens]SFE53128.1 hypothetical protein SAMN02745121_04565 [Nannocystis exedens]